MHGQDACIVDEDSRGAKGFLDLVCSRVNGLWVCDVAGIEANVWN